jgi:hypothetical protein
LQASPLMPLVSISYFLDLSAINLRDYLLGTLAALSALLGYVSLAVRPDRVSRRAPPWHLDEHCGRRASWRRP